MLSSNQRQVNCFLTWLLTTPSTCICIVIEIRFYTKPEPPTTNVKEYLSCDVTRRTLPLYLAAPESAALSKYLHFFNISD